MNRKDGILDTVLADFTNLLGILASPSVEDFHRWHVDLLITQKVLTDVVQ